MAGLSRLSSFAFAYSLMASGSIAALSLSGSESWDAYMIASLAMYMVAYSVYRPGGGPHVRVATAIVGVVLALLLLARISRVIG